MITTCHDGYGSGTVGTCTSTAATLGSGYPLAPGDHSRGSRGGNYPPLYESEEIKVSIEKANEGVQIMKLDNFIHDLNQYLKPFGLSAEGRGDGGAAWRKDSWIAIAKDGQTYEEQEYGIWFLINVWSDDVESYTYHDEPGFCHWTIDEFDENEYIPELDLSHLWVMSSPNHDYGCGEELDTLEINAPNAGDAMRSLASWVIGYQHIFDTKQEISWWTIDQQIECGHPYKLDKGGC